MSKVGFTAAAILLATSGAALAGGIDERRAAQAHQIEGGRESGSITWSEGLKLRAEQNRIARAEALFRGDGYLSSSERRILRHMQNEAAEHIAEEKSDGWRRARWMPRFGL